MTVLKEEKARLRLKVVRPDKREVGRGIARVNERHIKEIGVSYGDIIQITGRRATSAVVGSAFPSTRTWTSSGSTAS